MKTSKKIQKTIRTRRIFSEELKRQVVKDIESGRVSISQAALEVGVTVTNVYRWVYRYSRYLKRGKTIVVEDQSES